MAVETFAERLAKQVEKAPAKETFNWSKKVYTWEREANQKRAIR